LEYLLNSEVDTAEPRAPGARFMLSLLACCPPWLEVRLDYFESYGALLGEILELLSICVLERYSVETCPPVLGS